jgi:glycosyltransferase involved in cell wall biosynthesis
MEPENNGHLVVHAFEKVITEYKLVMVGDAPYNKEYIDNLKKTKDQRIIFTGFIFGKGYKELGSNAFCYIQATSVGGTHPALIESMGMGNCVIANDTPEHREVAGDAAVYFEKNSEESLREMLQKAVDNELSIEELRQKARKKIADEYTWDAVTKSYDKLFNDLLNGKKPQIIQ